jgi:hypothetical protein
MKTKKLTPEQERRRALARLKIAAHDARFVPKAKRLADEYLKGMEDTEEEISSLVSALISKALVHAFFRGLNEGRRCALCKKLLRCPGCEA